MRAPGVLETLAPALALLVAWRGRDPLIEAGQLVVVHHAAASSLPSARGQTQGSPSGIRPMNYAEAAA